MKPSGRHIVSSLKRAYTAQAQTARSADTLTLAKQDPKVSRLGNGTVIASLENNGPVAQVALLVNAGPRHEPAGQLGLTSCLRSAVGLSNDKTSQFGLARNLQQLGSNIGCTSTREHMVYHVDCLRDDIETAVQFLGEAALKPSFQPYEVPVLKNDIQLEHSMYMDDIQTRLIEALHKAAFRGGLGNSLYCAQHKIGWHSSNMLRDYVSKNYSGSNMALVGLNVDHTLLTYMAKDMAIPNTPAPAVTPSQYTAEQERIDANTDLVYAAVTTEGLGMNSPDLLKLYVLQKVMGSGTAVKYGASCSKVGKAAGLATNAPFAATCINATYSDAGLFGFQVIAHSPDAGKVIQSVATSFREAANGGITDADVQQAKNQLKAAILMEMESSSTFLMDLGVQALLSGQVLTMNDVVKSIDQITTGDINSLAKKVINGKPSMAAIGDLSSTPYVDQI